MNIVRTLSSSLVLLAMVACQGPGSLAGDWEGSVDCEGGGYESESFDAAIELDGSGSEYDGDGVIELGDIEGEAWEVVFDLEVEKEKAWGAQDLEIDVDDCTLEVEGQTADELDCDSIEDAEWDGKDEITADIEGFLGLDWDCEMSLDR